MMGELVPIAFELGALVGRRPADDQRLDMKPLAMTADGLSPTAGPEIEPLSQKQLSCRCEFPRHSAQRVDELQPASEKLQRWIAILLFPDPRVERIAHDWESYGHHMNSKLVLFSGLRNQTEEPDAFPRVEQFNFGDRVGRTFHDPLTKPRLA